MKLEDCTKEELIYLIRSHEWLSETYDIEFEILTFRAETAKKKANQYAIEAAKCRDEYDQIIAQYSGTSMADTPDEIIYRTSLLSVCQRSYEKKSERNKAKYNQLIRQVNKISNDRCKNKFN